MLYRSMKADSDGLPIIASKRWGLGVRTSGEDTDVFVASDGTVGPLDGGMSVAKDWRDIYRAFIPRELRGTNDRYTMFRLREQDLPAGLAVRQRGKKTHYQVEAARRMPITRYRELLAETQDLWEKVSS